MGIDRACGLHCVGRSRMNTETYNEDRIANAFRGSPLSDLDLTEIQRRCAEDNIEWKRRKNRRESVREVFDPVQIERGRKSAERHRRKSKWVKRELSETEKLQLQSVWGG